MFESFTYFSPRALRSEEVCLFQHKASQIVEDCHDNQGISYELEGLKNYISKLFFPFLALMDLNSL